MRMCFSVWVLSLVLSLSLSVCMWACVCVMHKITVHCVCHGRAPCTVACVWQREYFVFASVNVFISVFVLHIRMCNAFVFVSYSSWLVWVSFETLRVGYISLNAFQAKFFHFCFLLKFTVSTKCWQFVFSYVMCLHLCVRVRVCVCVCVYVCLCPCPCTTTSWRPRNLHLAPVMLPSYCCSTMLMAAAATGTGTEPIRFPGADYCSPFWHCSAQRCPSVPAPVPPAGDPYLRCHSSHCCCDCRHWAVPRARAAADAFACRAPLASDAASGPAAVDNTTSWVPVPIVQSAASAHARVVHSRSRPNVPA